MIPSAAVPNTFIERLPAAQFDTWPDLIEKWSPVMEVLRVQLGSIPEQAVAGSRAPRQRFLLEEADDETIREKEGGESLALLGAVSAIEDSISLTRIRCT